MTSHERRFRRAISSQNANCGIVCRRPVPWQNPYKPLASHYLGPAGGAIGWPLLAGIEYIY